MLFPLHCVLLVPSPFFYHVFFFGLMLFYWGEAHRFTWFGRWVKGNRPVNGGFMALIGFSGMSMTTVQHTKETGNLVGRV